MTTHPTDFVKGLALSVLALLIVLFVLFAPTAFAAPVAGPAVTVEVGAPGFTPASLR